MASFGDRKVLVVDDDETDRYFISRALQRSVPEVMLTTAIDGSNAISIIHRERPHLVLLDLSLPDMDGHDILRQVRDDPAISATAIIVLSGSTNPGDIRACYELNANAYAIKPDSPSGFERLANGIREFWLGTAELPELRLSA